jgi:hypothetical protein
MAVRSQNAIEKFSFSERCLRDNSKPCNHLQLEKNFLPGVWRAARKVSLALVSVTGVRACLCGKCPQSRKVPLARKCG